MRPDWTDYPLSIFTDVASHIVGRLFLILISVTLAVFLGSGIAASTGDHVGWFNGIMFYPIMIVGGIAQFWGIGIYLSIGIICATYFVRDIPPKWLLIVIVLQAFEAYRWSSSWEIGKS